jgi:DNA invertase Pin-like site-specific DNA recombinase
MTHSTSGSVLQPPLTARNGHTLRVLGIARISTEHQNALSLDDQEALLRGWLSQHTDLPVDLIMIKGRGSGECLDRQEALQAEELVATRTFDLVIAEDLGRIFRRIHAQLFCETCEDHDTRLIALNDSIDTAQDNWRVLAGFATMRHEMYNADTAKRIRRSLRNRFLQGGVVQTVVFGYVKPPGVKTDAELHKDPAAEPIYAEMFRQLEDGASYSEVADWLNYHVVKPGPWARRHYWDCQLVSQLLHNPILKGVRVRNRKMAKRVNETGRRKSVAAPRSELLERPVPHLAFIEPQRYDSLLAKLDERNARFRRKGINGIDQRKGVPKKRTVWPGQHIICGICGRPYVYGGNGQADNLMCRGAKEYRCWNAVAVDGPDAAIRLMAAISAAIAALPEFDPVLVDLVQQELCQGLGDQDRRRQEVAQRLTGLEREMGNVLAAIRDVGHSSTLLQELNRLEREKTSLLDEQQRLMPQANHVLRLPTVAEIRALAETSFSQLAVTSCEFGRLLRRLIPTIVVKPYRLCDGGHPVLRAHFTLSLASLLPGGSMPERLAAGLQENLVVDLFDAPQREAFRKPVVELTANGLKQRDIAWELQLTQPAVQRAVALDKRLRQLGLTDPYVLLSSPPADYGRLRRHQHQRYHFEPLTALTSVRP